MTTADLIKSFIQKNQLEEALEAFLLHSSDERSKNTALILSGQLKDLNRKLALGVISESKAMKRKTKFAYILLNLLNESIANPNTAQVDEGPISLDENLLIPPVFNQTALLKLIYAYALKEPDQWISSKELQDHFRIEHKTLIYYLLQLKEKELIHVNFLMDKSLVKITANGILIIRE